MPPPEPVAPALEGSGVAAVVVTYNRRELLEACLDALAAQTVPPAETIVIDNASTDGTPELLAERYGWARVVRLVENLGGAGGFSHGLELALRGGHRLAWVMDDDTIPRPYALERFLEAERECPPQTQILASRVEWSDGSAHPMNAIPPRDPRDGFTSPGEGIVPIRSGSFVSLLVRCDAIERFGLPHAEYFIWNDDLEWSARVLRELPGYLVEASVVEHRTKAPYMPSSAAGERFYFELRNKLWMLRTRSWRPREKPIHLWHLAYNTREFLRHGGYGAEAWRTVGRGLRDGLRRKPKRRFAEREDRAGSAG